MSRNLFYTDYFNKVIDVATIMYNRKAGSMIIKKNGNPEGILTERDIISKCVIGKGNIFNISAGEIMSDPVICVDSDTPVLKACHLMSEKRIKKLIVIDEKGKIVGLITQTDIVKNMDKIASPDRFKIHVGSRMIKDLIYADYNESVMGVVDIMGRTNVGSVVIMQEGNPGGIITERDIVKNCIIGNANIIRLRAKDIMSKPIKYIHESDTILEAAHVMTDKHIKKLLIINVNGITVGIITQTDIINYLANLDY